MLLALRLCKTEGEGGEGGCDEAHGEREGRVCMAGRVWGVGGQVAGRARSYYGGRLGGGRVLGGGGRGLGGRQGAEGFSPLPPSPASLQVQVLISHGFAAGADQSWLCCRC